MKEKRNEKLFEKIGIYGLLLLMAGFGMVMGIESQSKMFAWVFFAGGLLLFFAEPILTKIKHFFAHYC